MCMNAPPHTCLILGRFQTSGFSFYFWLTDRSRSRNHFARSGAAKQSIPRRCLGHEIRFLAFTAGSARLAWGAGLFFGRNILSFVFSMTAIVVGWTTLKALAARCFGSAREGTSTVAVHGRWTRRSSSSVTRRILQSRVTIGHIGRQWTQRIRQPVG